MGKIGKIGKRETERQKHRNTETQERYERQKDKKDRKDRKERQKDRKDTKDKEDRNRERNVVPVRHCAKTFMPFLRDGKERTRPNLVVRCTLHIFVRGLHGREDKTSVVHDSLLVGLNPRDSAAQVWKYLFSTHQTPHIRW